MASTADDSVNASQEWIVAQKIRRAIQQEVERIKSSSGSKAEGSEIERFEKLDALISQYRLKCMVTVYGDIKYASKEKVETSLWTTHVLINSAYRKVKDKYEKQDKVVTKRRIVKLYDAFIKTVQLFYKGHLQRLCARYADLPELHRLVTGGAVERSEGLDNTPRVDAMATGVKDQVLNSAYLTLIYLGDLWRYRTQLRHQEGRKYDAALAYYRLATDLDPRSGYAYHQMGVIFLEQEKHFEIVYHFYRSLAADEPHPNAAKNLENEFGRVLKVRASASPKGQGPHHVLQDWIVRLHAHFYLGKTFPQHAELEEEVLHRFGLAVKAHDFVEGLLKIALTNICAYQVAQDKVAAEWTTERSQTCHFTLGLNIRTITVILRQLESELMELADNLRSAPEQQQATVVSSSPDNDSMFNLLIGNALPLLRVYMAWLYMYRADIIKFEPHLQPYVGQMYKGLSAVLTSLFEVLRHCSHLETVPYLFTEDMGAFGLKALNRPTVSHGCLLVVDPLTHKPKSRPDGTEKFKTDDISYTRALDITTRGFALAGDSEFPLTVTESQTPGGDISVKFAYLREGKTPSPNVTASKTAATYTSSTPGAVGSPAQLDVRPPPVDSPLALAPTTTQMNATMHTGGSNGFAQGLTLVGGPQAPLATGLSVSPFPPQLAQESNFAVDHDSRMNDLVNGLVEPSESGVSEDVPAQNETSYGMHTTTARDVFASGLPSTASRLAPRGNAASGTPWAWNSIPEPTRHQRGISSGSAQDVWSGAAARQQPFAKGSFIDKAIQHSLNNANNVYGPVGSASGYQAATGLAASNAQGTWNNFRSASHGTSATTGLAGQTSSGYPTSTNTPWNPSGSSKFSSIQDILGAQLNALVPGPSSFRPMASTPAPVSPAVPSSFGSTNFSGATSSLPPVNSPWGVPTRAAGGSTNSPAPIGPPAHLSGAHSRSNSRGNSVGFSSWPQGSTGSVSCGPAANARQPTSRPNSGLTQPGLSAANSANGSANGTAPQPAQNREDAYEAMLRKLQNPKS